MKENYYIINDISISERDYFTVIHYFNDWCFWNKRSDENITKNDIEKFKKEMSKTINKNEEIINAALIKYYSYVDDKNNLFK